MTRTIFAVASAIAAILAYATAAQACISCEYTPEVVKSGESARPSTRVRAYTEQRERRSVKKRVSTRESEPVKAKTKTSTAKAASEPTVAVAKATPTAENEHSAITTTGSSISNQVKAAITPAPTGPQNENSTISSAAVTTDTPSDVKGIEQATVDKNVGCKKYFPSTGLTLTVPCE